ncbi:hypothetical protein ABZX85_47185 [Streptomyces sp. NPDC004539]
MALLTIVTDTLTRTGTVPAEELELDGLLSDSDKLRLRQVQPT